MNAPYRRGAELPVFVVHWLVVGAVGVSLATGLRIAADHARGWRAVADGLGPLVPEGRVFDWHVTSGLMLTAAVLAGMVLIVASGRQRWRLAREARRGRKANVALHWLAAGLLVASVATGLAQLTESPGLPDVASMSAVHRWVGVALAVYLFAHVGAHLAEVKREVGQIY